MNILSIINNTLLAGMLMLSVSCEGIEGDNSDYNFEHETATADPSRLPDSFRLATYNTHRCSATNNVVNYDNTATVIKLIDADVIALQELDKNTNRYDQDQLQELADRTGLYPVFLPTVTYTKGQYGIGLLCKERPLNVYTRELPGKEIRGMILAEFENFIFICTHLCVSSADNRSWSYEIINQYIKDNLAYYKKPIYLAGDLNATSLPTQCTSHWQAISCTTPTFYSTSRRIDYILQYKDNGASYKVLRSMVPSYGQIRLTDVSDHLPVFVDLSKN